MGMHFVMVNLIKKEYFLPHNFGAEVPYLLMGRWKGSEVETIGYEYKKLPKSLSGFKDISKKVTEDFEKV